MNEPSTFDKVVSGIKVVASIVNTLIKGGGDVEGQIQRLSELTRKMLENNLAMVQLEYDLRNKARMLEESLKEVERWEKEKELYEIKNISPHNAFAYMLKESSGTADAEYRLCATCFEKRKKSILQPEPARLKVLRCYDCGLEIPLT